jgi:two-component sensor histidine kinase/sensor domain CHASE-containing protein
VGFQLWPGFRRVQTNALVGLLIVCALLAALAVVWMVNSARVRTDQIAAEREQRLAENGLRLRIREMQKTVVTETVWDDAVRNLDRRFDRRWAEANMVTFFEETSGYEIMAVLDGQGRILISHMPVSTGDRAWPQIEGEVNSLIASIRGREAVIQRPTTGLPSKTMISQPVDATTVVRVDGRPFLLVAALVQPDFGTVQASRPAPVVVVGDAIDEGFLKSFGEAYFLHDARLLAPEAAPKPGLSILPIRNQQGGVVARVGWVPEAPAGDLINYLSLPLGTLILVLALMPIGILSWERRRAAQLQARIGERDAALKDLRTAMSSMVELREHNAWQKVLLDELNHRVKNSLASVQSIALQTLKGADDLDQFRETFQARLIALSQTHELLVAGLWTNVALSALVRQHLDHYGRRYVIEGEDLLLSPNYTLSLGMALHEMATNALKYGAWSKGDSGEVVIRVGAIAGQDMYQLTWTEQGGPKISAPRRKGFGSRLLKSVSLEMGGDVTVEYPPSGLRYIVRIAGSDSVKSLGAVQPAPAPTNS